MIVMIPIQHATNALPSGYAFDNQPYFPVGTSGSLPTRHLLQESHWAYDPGALQAAQILAQVIMNDHCSS
jgi:predicted N-formylglutamate amidohydrolase